jgi:hypothetical protein
MGSFEPEGVLWNHFEETMEELMTVGLNGLA